MTPSLPWTNPPVHSIVETFGFQSPQVDMSDQIFQTCCGDAVVSTEVPYSAISSTFIVGSVTSRPLGYGIDFGTSNSAVAIAYADRVEVVPLGSARTLPRRTTSAACCSLEARRTSRPFAPTSRRCSAPNAWSNETHSRPSCTD